MYTVEGIHKGIEMHNAYNFVFFQILSIYISGCMVGRYAPTQCIDNTMPILVLEWHSSWDHMQTSREN